MKLEFLKFLQKSHEHLSLAVSFLINLQAWSSQLYQKSDSCHFIKKDTPAQVLSHGFYEILKTTYFIEHLPATGSNY